MRNDIKKKINEILDSDLKGTELMLALENEIAKLAPFDHNNPDSIEASGLEDDIDFEFSFIGSMSMAVEKLITSTSKREIAYIFLKGIIPEQQDDIYSNIFKNILNR